MATAIMRFTGQRRYRDDERYLKLWMRYADLTDDPNKVFLMLKSKAIGTQLALFWAAWAYVLELDESYSGAMRVLAEGKVRGAAPVSLLEEFQDAFHERMCRKMQMAHTDPEKCAIEKMAQLGQAGKKSPESALHEKLEQCEQLEQRSSRTLSNQGLSDKEAEAPIDSMDGGGAGCVETAQCTPIGGVDKSTRSAFGLHGDLFTHAAGTCQWCTVRSDSKKPSRGLVGCDCGSTAIDVIQDPFSANKRQLLTVDTAQYRGWARSSTIVNDSRQETDDLITLRPTPAKTNGGSRRRVVHSQTLGTQVVDVLGVLGQGAAAVVFSCKGHEDQRDVAVKIEHQVKQPSIPWECFTMLQLHERLLHRRLSDGNNSHQPTVVVVKPESLFLYRDGCAMTMPQGPFGTLHDLVSLYAKKSQAIPQLIVMHYSVEMLRFCRAMHSVSILHMDIKPDNWLLTSRPADGTNRADGGKRPGSIEHSLSLIDFGRSIDLSIFPDNGSGVTFSGSCCASNFSCPAMTEGRTWKHDADLFALGSSIYYMLHGAYLELHCEGEADSAPVRRGRRWRPVKRYWPSDLWDRLLDELLNFDYRSSDTGSTEEVLGQLEALLCSYMGDLQRPYELQECLRKQANMFFNR
ncbi:unnamed protein product [Laminaria digitata]